MSGTEFTQPFEPVQMDGKPLTPPSVPSWKPTVEDYLKQEPCIGCDVGIGTHEEHVKSNAVKTPAPESVRDILNDRGKKYGPFDRHATITQQLKRVVYGYADLDRLQDDQREALDMICHKIGRIVNGDPNYADSWVDIAGYAQLVADRLNGVSR